VNAPINTQLSDLSLYPPPPTFYYPLSRFLFPQGRTAVRGKNAFRPNKKLIKLKASFPAKVQNWIGDIKNIWFLF